MKQIFVAVQKIQRFAYSPDGGMAATTIDEMDAALWQAAAEHGYGMGDITPTIVWEGGKPVVVTKPAVSRAAVAHIEDLAAQRIVEKRRQHRPR